MHFQTLVAAFAVLGLATASPARRPLSARRNNFIGRRQDTPSLSSTGLAKLESLGFGSQGVPATGVNAVSGGSEGVWIGTDGAYTVTYNNISPGEVVLVVWGDQPAYQASFPEAVQPLITISLAGGNGTATLSFNDGQSGAWAGVYSDTEMTQYGQISQTWGEFTMSASGVVDVSREVYTNGNPLSIVGPDCTTDMNTCVFQCVDPTVTTCGTSGSYVLNNCATGSQPGAQVNDADNSGGCGWLGATSVALTATFS